MAGVYVPGMKKPYGCTFCPWYQTFCSFCKAANKNISVLDMNKGPDWCPLVEVPDHGDLVDRGALEDTVLRLNFPEEYPSDDVAESWEITRNQYKMIDNVLFQMPTVIPADKEEV